MGSGDQNLVQVEIRQREAKGACFSIHISPYAYIVAPHSACEYGMWLFRLPRRHMRAVACITSPHINIYEVYTSNHMEEA